MNFVAHNGSAKAVKDTNIRKGQPSTTSPIVGKISAGQIVQFVGWVTDGECVGSVSKWFQMSNGNYFWSGNVEVLPDTPTSSVLYQGVTAAQLRSIVPSVPVAKADAFALALNTAMEEFTINTSLRQSAFIAQTAHESMGYTTFLENLNYSAKALRATWPSRFTEWAASNYARKPEKIANRAYANRLGNSDEASGDGWKYRGRGIIQITGKDNYRACGAALGIDLVASPELLEQPLCAFRSGAWFWKSRDLNPIADRGDFTKVTKIINGGVLGLDDRLRYYVRAKTELGVS